MLHKICPKCLIDKPFSQYSKCSARKDGVRYECKPCAVKARAEWTVKNLERSRELNRNWTRKNPEKNRAKSSAWAKANPLWKKAQDQLYRQGNKEKLAEQSKAYRAKNAHRLRQEHKTWYEANRERLSTLRKLRYQETKEASREYSLKFKKENRAYYNAVGRLRSLKKKNATPKWLTTEHLEQMHFKYMLADLAAFETGIAHHVDHIIPIMGRTVCGLHVPWNLQVLTQEENLKKGNRIPPELKDWVLRKD